MTGAEIKAFRRRELLTQEMLAQAIGTLQAHISGWEKESRPIPAEQEAKLRQLVGASPQERWEMLAEIRKNKAEASTGESSQDGQGRRNRQSRPKLLPLRTPQPKALSLARPAPTGSTWTARKAQRCTAPASRRPAMPVLAA